MADALSRDEYEALIDELAADAIDRAGGRPEEDDLWGSIRGFAPEMSGPVCEQILALSTSEPLEELVEYVADERESDAAEYRRAEAATVLLQDVEARARSRTVE